MPRLPSGPGHPALFLFQKRILRRLGGSSRRELEESSILVIRPGLHPIELLVPTSTARVATPAVGVRSSSFRCSAIILAVLIPLRRLQCVPSWAIGHPFGVGRLRDELDEAGYGFGAIVGAVVSCIPCEVGSQ